MKTGALQLAASAGARKSNLAFALAGLPPVRRADALTFYGFCRAVDDIADEPGRTPEEKSRLLDAWISALTDGNGLPAPLQRVISAHNLPPDLLIEIVRGMKMDIHPVRYPTYAELQQYCWRAACAVGLASIRIFGCESPASADYAEQLGYALQLTNILRDVAEDAAQGRIYLPAEDLRQFGVEERSLLAGAPDAGFAALMQFEASRASSHFAAAGRLLPEADRKALLPAEIMRELYRRILARMERGGFQVFRTRYRISTAEKLGILLYARLFPRSLATSSRVGIT
ncbi:MAG TPA: squalene/phytoene synthase family protein [Terrimicrobiaceae bacterium]|nr:squalene/phytoene synthase family protein [Terrimicrobiaceae bacterium]